MKKKLRIPLIILAAMLAIAGGCTGYFFLCVAKAEPPVLLVNGTAVAHYTLGKWNGSSMDPIIGGFGPENTVNVALGDPQPFTLRAGKAQWWAPRWRVRPESYGVYDAASLEREFTVTTNAVYWAEEFGLNHIHDRPGSYIIELWATCNSWLQPLFGDNSVCYSFVVNVE